MSGGLTGASNGVWKDGRCGGGRGIGGCCGGLGTPWQPRFESLRSGQRRLTVVSWMELMMCLVALDLVKGFVEGVGKGMGAGGGDWDCGHQHKVVDMVERRGDVVG
ncbi:hypothetical protein RIF29_20555 [Crotalaria pallida]|uniref:Uncharacterized protein n=1 Tax=Crotalaria pallida TaxID=3830 RepID=A0AAN9F3Q4_CROPI